MEMATPSLDLDYFLANPPDRLVIKPKMRVSRKNLSRELKQNTVIFTIHQGTLLI